MIHIRIFCSVFTSIVLVLTYIMFFYLSADTPVSSASLRSLVVIFGMIISLSAAISGILIMLPIIAEMALPNNPKISKYIEISFVFLVTFSGLLLLIENWTYSLFSYGLKTETTWWSKGLFLLVASYLACQFAPLARSLGRFLAGHYRLFFPIVLLIICVAPVFYRIQSSAPISSDMGISHSNKNLNIVILVSDGVTASEMSVYGSPNKTTPFLDSIRSELMVFTNAFHNNTNTTGSLASLITGVSPLSSKVVFPPDIMQGSFARKSLPRILGELGYYRSLWGVPHWVDAESLNLVGAFDRNNTRSEIKSVKTKYFIDSAISSIGLNSLESWFLRSSIRDIFGVLQDVFFIEELENPFAYVTSEQKSTRLSDSLRLKNVLLDIEEMTESDTPFYVIAHFMKTHGGMYHPNNRIFSIGMDEDQGGIVEFYRDAIVDFDQSVESVYKLLRSTGQLDNTIIIIASDHPMRGSKERRVPLIVRLPFSTANGDYNVNVQLIDIAPTIVELMGFNIPIWMDGDSLLHPHLIPPDRYILRAEVVGSNTEKLKKGGLIRRKSSDKFAYRTRFSVVYCDLFMASDFPLLFEPVKINGMPQSTCRNTSIRQVAENAKEIVERKLKNN